MSSMRERWNARARADAFLYVESGLWDGDVDAFFALGEERSRIFLDPVLAAHAPARRRAAEIGCGLGRFTRALARRFDEVAGVDVSDEMVERARSLHDHGAGGSVRFLAGDGTTLPLEDGWADLVFSYEVFQHMPSRAVVDANLREAARVLAPDGIALIHVRTRDDASARDRLRAAVPVGVRQAVKRALRIGDPLMHDATFAGAPPPARDELEGLFRAAGLGVVEVRDDPTHPPRTRAFVVARRA